MNFTSTRMVMFRRCVLIRRSFVACSQTSSKNAIKYTPDGGRIVLSAAVENSHVAIDVADNGRGIPAEDLPILFDKFHRGRPARHSAAIADGVTNAEFLEDADVSGVGLGLYLA